jgi:hypothetical protein
LKDFAQEYNLIDFVFWKDQSGVHGKKDWGEVESQGERSVALRAETETVIGMERKEAHKKY